MRLQLTADMVIVDYDTPIKTLVRLAAKHTDSPERYPAEWFKVRKAEAEEHIKK
jgi:hypothetical protein